LDGGNGGAVGRSDDIQSAATLADRNLGVLPYALSRRELDQRSRHPVRGQTEIALWKRIKTGCLEAKVEADPQRHSSGCGEILLKAGKEIIERALAPG
jgi:hypothetical protein